MSRFRVVFAKREEVRYISHLDLMRTWERILRRARLRIAHTTGFNPRPRLIFAAPLSVGTTSDSEIVDMLLEEDMTAEQLLRRLEPGLPPGMPVIEVTEIALNAPPVMAIAASADYEVEVIAEDNVAHAEESLTRFLAQETVLYERTRKGRSRQANLRPLVQSLRILEWDERKRLALRLTLDQQGSAVKPAEVVQALSPGWQAGRIHRTRVQLAGGAATPGEDHVA